MLQLQQNFKLNILEKENRIMIVGEVKQQESYVLLPLDKLKYQLQLNKVLFS